MDLRFYDWEGKLLCIVPRMESVNWRVHYNEVGTLEVHMNVDSPQAKTIMENKYMIAICGKLQAVVVMKTIEKHELIVFGRTLNWLLQKRVVMPPEGEKTRNIINEVKKCIPRYMYIGTIPSGAKEAEDVIERSGAEVAGTAVENLLKLANLGHAVRLEKQSDGTVRYIFDVLEGKETEIVLSEDLRNVQELVYTDDMLDYCSAGYYLKDEVWTEYVKDSTKEGIYRFEGVLDSDNRTDAGNEFNELRWKRVCEGKVKVLKLFKDYELGDIIKIKFKRGSFSVTTKYRITGVHIWYEGESEGEEPEFEEVVD